MDNVVHVPSNLVRPLSSIDAPMEFDWISMVLDDRYSLELANRSTVVDEDERPELFSSKQSILLIQRWLKVLPKDKHACMVKWMLVEELNSLRKELEERDHGDLAEDQRT